MKSMSHRGRTWLARLFLTLIVALFFFGTTAEASFGDRQPEFRECVDVCTQENCGRDKEPTPIPLHHRLLLWDCPAECDYTCQHIVTARRQARGEPVVQYHGKWPFVRALGMQEPFSVLFSLGNLAAHWDGLRHKVRAGIPAAYPLRRYYELLACVGMATWLSSALFHTRDLRATERLDYLAAAASVFYGFYYTPVRIFRLDRPDPRRRSLRRAWTLLCAALYAAHVAYLTLWRWDYGYNMAANVAAGVVQNALWSCFSWSRYRRTGRAWAVWPGVAVAWIMMAMSLELLDFPPWWGALDAHSLWHLGTIAPTILWYNFLVKDAQDDIAGTERLKQ